MTGERSGDLSAKEQLDTNVSLDQKFKDLYALIDDLKVSSSLSSNSIDIC